MRRRTRLLHRSVRPVDTVRASGRCRRKDEAWGSDVPSPATSPVRPRMPQQCHVALTWSARWA